MVGFFLLVLPQILTSSFARSLSQQLWQELELSKSKVKAGESGTDSSTLNKEGATQKEQLSPADMAFMEAELEDSVSLGLAAPVRKESGSKQQKAKPDSRFRVRSRGEKAQESTTVSKTRRERSR